MPTATANYGSLEVTTATVDYASVVDRHVVNGNGTATVRVTNDNKEEISDHEYDFFNNELEILVIICSVLGAFVLIGNIFILGISKFASGGKSPTLVFVRSLCVADAVAGVFAVSKGIQAS